MFHRRTKALLISSALAVSGITALGVETAGAACPIPTYFVRNVGNYAPSTGNWYTNPVVTPPTGNDCTDVVLWYAGHTTMYKGQFRTGGVWVDGRLGWSWRTAGTSQWTVLLDNVVDGASTRATEYLMGHDDISIYA